MSWSKVVQSAPVDGLARRVTSRSPEVSFDPVNRGKAVESETPFPVWTTKDLRELRGREQSIRKKHAEIHAELVGKRSGRLVVIGLARDFPKRWVAKCSCGFYVLRTAKVLRSENDDDCCITCRNAKDRAKARRWKAGLS